MHSCKGYLYAKCQITVTLQKEEADERLGGCDFRLRNSDFSGYNKEVNKLTYI